MSKLLSHPGQAPQFKFGPFGVMLVFLSVPVHLITLLGSIWQSQALLSYLTNSHLYNVVQLASKPLIALEAEIAMWGLQDTYTPWTCSLYVCMYCWWQCPWKSWAIDSEYLRTSFDRPRNKRQGDTLLVACGVVLYVNKKWQGPVNKIKPSFSTFFKTLCKVIWCRMLWCRSDMLDGICLAKCRKFCWRELWTLVGARMLRTPASTLQWFERIYCRT